MNFKVGDKVRPQGCGEYLEIIQIDSLTRSLPRYMVLDDFGTFWDYCINWEKEVSSDEVLRYGEYLTDDQMHHVDANKPAWTRIRTIRYEGHVYYHKIVDGEVVKFKELI